MHLEVHLEGASRRRWERVWTYENGYEKIKLASQYLEEAENELKNGDAIQGCINQKKAAGFGIEATESLIKAFQANGSQNDIENIKTGLKKWKELRDFC